jgi:hypothetical protein
MKSESEQKENTPLWPIGREANTSVKVARPLRQGMWFKATVAFFVVIVVPSAFVFDVSGKPSFVSPGTPIFKNGFPPSVTIDQVMWSPNGQYLAYANSVGAVWVVSATNGSKVEEYQSHACPKNRNLCWINTLA